MNTLSDRFGNYDRFDLSDDTFGNISERWTDYVPPTIIDVWKVLTEDERYLVAYMADYAADMSAMNGQL